MMKAFGTALVVVLATTTGSARADVLEFRGGRTIVHKAEVREPRALTSRSVRGAALYADTIKDVAERHDLDERLVVAVIAAESDFDEAAVSSAGAQGLMQLMPATAEMYGVVDPFDPASNVAAGGAHLAMLLDRYGSTRLALAAYNAGEAAVDRYGGVPPYPETRSYVTKIMGMIGRREPVPLLVTWD